MRGRINFLEIYTQCVRTRIRKGKGIQRDTTEGKGERKKISIIGEYIKRKKEEKERVVEIYREGRRKEREKWDEGEIKRETEKERNTS